jgi:hypothetical protein
MNLCASTVCGFFGLAVSGLVLRADEPGATDLAVLIEIFELTPGISQSLDPALLVDQQLRPRLDDWTAAGDASLVDCSYIRLEKSTTAILASRLEVMYGTEGDPPEVPNEITIDGAKGGSIRPTDATFTAFESDFEGLWSEVDARLVDQSVDGAIGGVDPFAAGVTRSSEHFVALAGSLLVWNVLKERNSLASDRGDPLQAPLADKWQPTFSRIAIAESLTLPTGHPRLIQMVDSPRDANRRVLIFATVWILRVLP